jgi:hypothetical protein
VNVPKVQQGDDRLLVLVAAVKKVEVAEWYAEASLWRARIRVS